jgi:3-hydroxyisobutyrate dehydrogenase
MRIAVLGTGILGSAIAERFHADGHHVTVYNRTNQKTALLQAHGITGVARPEQAIRAAEVTLLTLADLPAIQSVLLDTETARALRGTTIIQMGTIGPEESSSLSQQLHQLGAAYFEAPVLGSVTEAKEGSLLIMVGATADQFSRWRKTLQVLGSDVYHIGAIGTAAVLKLALNQLIAAETAAFALSLGLIRRTGGSTDTFMTLLRKSAVFAPTFDKKLPRMLERHYDRPNFSARHLLKDIDLVVRTAKHHELNATGLDGVRRLLEGALARGLADCDYSSLYEAVDPAG